MNQHLGQIVGLVDIGRQSPRIDRRHRCAEVGRASTVVERRRAVVVDPKFGLADDECVRAATQSRRDDDVASAVGESGDVARGDQWQVGHDDSGRFGRVGFGRLPEMAVDRNRQRIVVDDDTGGGGGRVREPERIDRERRGRENRRLTACSNNRIKHRRKHQPGEFAALGGRKHAR